MFEPRRFAGHLTYICCWSRISMMLRPSCALQETYIAVSGSAAPGWTDIGKVYLRFDDKDTLVGTNL